MDKGKKMILIFLGLLMIILLIIICIFNMKRNDDSIIKDPSNPNPSVTDKNFARVNDYDEFYGIQKAVNDNININESFIAEEIYANNGNLKYYFINGIIIENNLVTDTTNYRNSVNYLVIVDSNNFYEIKELESNIEDLQGYANNYDFQNKQINSNKKFKNISITSEDLLKSYLAYFKNLLINDSLKAYDMLSKETKAKYNNLEDFSNKKYDIYNLLSSNIFSYSKQDKNETIYFIEDNNRNKITIHETSIMNFKITY